MLRFSALRCSVSAHTALSACAHMCVLLHRAACTSQAKSSSTESHKKANVRKIWAGWTVFTLWGKPPISPLAVLLLPWTSLFWVLTHANNARQHREIVQIYWKALATRLKNKRQNKLIDWNHVETDSVSEDFVKNAQSSLYLIVYSFGSINYKTWHQFWLKQSLHCTFFSVAAKYYPTYRMLIFS